MRKRAFALIFLIIFIGAVAVLWAVYVRVGNVSVAYGGGLLVAIGVYLAVLELVSRRGA
jgi:hypothetical protein